MAHGAAPCGDAASAGRRCQRRRRHRGMGLRHEMEAKRAIGSRKARVQRFAQVWPDLHKTLAARWVGADVMQQRLQTLGAAAHPADLGISLATLAADYR